MFKLGDTLDKQHVINMNPIVLAFVGDAVYSLFVRERIATSSDYKTGEMNKLAVSEVKAVSQAEFVKDIMSLFTEDELAVFKRARNAKKTTRAKNASVVEYNMSTGFEAVIGYLYMIGDNDRLNFLLNKGKTNEG